MAADWGSYYGPGGQSATYVSNMGSPSGHGGHGHHGHGSLSGQIEGFMGDFPDPNESLNALLKYAEQKQVQQRLLAEKERRRQQLEAAKARQAENMQRNPSLEQATRDAQLRAQAAVAQAQYGQAPLKYQGVSGGIGGYVLDEDAMSGAQRQAFLPGNAQMAGPAGPSPAGLGPSPVAIGNTYDSPEAQMAATLDNLRSNLPDLYANYLMLRRRG